jgi:hypothetical protein
MATTKKSSGAEVDTARRAPATNVAADAKVVAKAAAGKKAKMVRDGFTMPASEYELLGHLKKRCLAQGVAAKKSELLRAAIATLAAASDATLLKAIKRLEIIKTGRPANGKG